MMLGGALAGCGGGDDDEASSTESPLQVSIDKGRLQGVEQHGQRAWLGIPYAAPPQGALRWKPPQPPTPWDGVRDASRFGPHCPQPDTAPLRYGYPGGQEDCLYLNVYAPKRSGPHPVIVWIHGGSYYLGRSNNYAPTRLVERDVIVVTLNYRLGVLGFLAHPALNDSSGRSGNYGLMDQQLALKWVRDNIAAFGGDARNVTVSGQSAGAYSVQAQLVSPLAAGLFDKAIVQSGGFANPPTAAQAQAAGVQTAAALGCPEGPEVDACLRALSPDTIVDKQPDRFAPNVDGALLPGSPRQLVPAGTFNKVPVLLGSNHDEHTVFVGITEINTGAPLTEAGYPAAAALAVTGTGVTAEQALSLYPSSAYGGSPSLALSAMNTDLRFACPGRALARSLSSHVPVYAYEFDDREAPQFLQPPVSFPYLAYHAAEIQFLFNANDAALDTSRQQLAASMATQWTHFARTGSPNGTQTPNWPAYDDRDVFFRLAPAGTTLTTDFAEDHHCEVWTPDA
ncbi:para-nitrobenzyl esterase [Caldimonas brevitalea]|uniref:Carboxylic ester hydrolase n=2 Tax=Caldimonas brevitalea TaxID=413882 RepID=A0A0G3BF74_9BURK|nr:para-nitrobenzyl esterase [Caldimonas brevitalea]